MRIGHGYDAHKLKHGRKCVLCGVKIPCGFGPDGHSDADVPVHALIDAMLGALALGDIGGLFPDSDEQWRDADSLELLKIVDVMISDKEYTIGNIDITIVVQSPRLAPYIQKMRANIANTLDIDIGKVNVKATTEDKMGFTGDGTGISATAVVLFE